MREQDLRYLCYKPGGRVGLLKVRPQGVTIDLVQCTWSYLDQEYPIGSSYRSQGPRAGRCIGVFDVTNPQHKRNMGYVRAHITSNETIQQFPGRSKKIARR